MSWYSKQKRSVLSKQIVFFFCLGLIFVAFQNFTESTVSLDSSSDNTLRLHLSPNGNDSNTGLTSSQPVRSLGRALDILSSQISKRKRPENFEVLIQPGLYQGQGNLKWTQFPSRKIKFIGVISKEGARPKFDGQSIKGQFFIRFNFPNPSTGLKPELEFKNMQISNYWEALTLSGSTREEPEAGSANHLLYNNVFNRIGASYVSGSGSAMAGVRLVNIKSSKFILNTFEDINNFSGSSLHAFYVSNYSSDNLFEANTFINHRAGSAIKIRDGSDHNKIYSNKFQNVYPGAIELWHCEQAVRSDCTKKSGERRSVGTIESGNLFLQVKSPLLVYTFSRYAIDIVGKYSVESTNQLFSSSGRFLHSTYHEYSKYYAYCSAEKDCVGRDRQCYSINTSSSRYICTSSNNSPTWESCSQHNLKERIGGLTCTLDADGKTFKWANTSAPAPLPKPQPTKVPPVESLPFIGYKVYSYYKNQINSAICLQATACVNHNRRCFKSGTGSQHSLCSHNVWYGCSAKTVGLKILNKTCIPFGGDYAWK